LNEIYSTFYQNYKEAAIPPTQAYFTS